MESRKRRTPNWRYLVYFTIWQILLTSILAAAFEDDELTVFTSPDVEDSPIEEDPNGLFSGDAAFRDKHNAYSSLYDDEEPRVTVTGVLGGRVGLPCNIQPNSTEDDVSLVLWYKDDSTTPIYSLDSRKTTLRNAHHSPVHWLNGRAYLKTTDPNTSPVPINFKRPAAANNDGDTGGPSSETSSFPNPTSLLELKDLEKQDEALYRCRVDFKKARTRNYEVQLKVIVPPSRITVTDQRGSTLPNNAIIGPYSGGDKLILKCHAHGGNPPSMVTWYRGSLPQSISSSKPQEDYYGDFGTHGLQILQSGEMQSELVFASLGQEDLLAAFTCVVSNNNISQPLISSVIIDVYFRPLHVWISTEAPSILSAGVGVIFNCSSSGSRPPAVIQWFKGGERIDSTTSSKTVSNNSSIGTWHTSTIELIPTPDDDGKQLTCRAENPAMPPSMNHDYSTGRHSNSITDGIKLQVHYVPQLVVRLAKKLRHSHIREGSDVILECDVRTNPTLIEMGWKYEGTELITDTSRGIVISEHSLVLQNVTRHNRGQYVCTGTNAEGTGESPPFHLRVRYEPICKHGQKQVFGAAKNEIVRISCELEADPDEVTIKWKTKKMKFGISSQNSVAVGNVYNPNGLAIEDDNSKETSYFVETIGTRSWLTIIPRSEEDYGPVICWGKNQMGRQKDPCVFTLIAAGPPGPVHNCSVINQTEESLTIACLEGYDGGSEGGQAFHMEVHDSANQNRVLIANLSTNITPPTLQASGLSPSTPYVCTIYASNERGTSQPTILVGTTIPRPLSLSSKGGFILDYLEGRLSFTTNPVLMTFSIVAAVCALGVGAAGLAILLRKGIASTQLFNRNKGNNVDKNEDEDSSIPLRDSKKEPHHDEITDIRDFGDNDKKCPDILSGNVVKTPMLSSPSGAESSFTLRRSPSCNSSLQRANGGGGGGRAITTNRCSNSRASWDFSKQRPKNFLPSSMSYQHMATLPRKSQGQQQQQQTEMKTNSTKTVTFDITTPKHPYSWVDGGSYSLSLPRNRGSHAAVVYESAVGSHLDDALFQRGSQRAKLLTLAEPQRAKVLKCPLSLPATTSVQSVGGPSSQQRTTTTTTTTLVHPHNGNCSNSRAPLAKRDEGHL